MSEGIYTILQGPASSTKPTVAVGIDWVLWESFRGNFEHFWAFAFQRLGSSSLGSE